MKASLEKILSSYKTTIVLLAVYALGLAIATFIEKAHGTPVAKMLVYYNPVFFFLQLLLVVNFIAALVEHQLIKKRKWGFIFIHGAFVVILLGALISHVFGEEGTLHLREGESSNKMEVRTNRAAGFHTFPFKVELVKFKMTRYPGSESPSAYESEVLVHVDGKTERHLIFMNNVLDVKGYRFFQASFDRDEKGTILSVNKDVAGRNVTYAGYFFLTLGFVLCLVEPKSRFRQLARRLKKTHGKAALTAILLLAGLAGAKAESPSMLDAVLKFSVPAEHAARFGALPMQSFNGRMMPVNTFSSEVLRKLYKEEKIGNLNSDQFLISLLAMSDMWMRVPFIKMANKEIANRYGLTLGYSSYLEAFDGNGRYKLQEALEEAYHKMPAERNKMDKDLMALDEQLNIINQLISHQMLNLFPLENDPNHKWHSAGDDLSVYSGQDSLFVSRIMDWYVMEVQNGLKDGNWEEADKVLGMISTYQLAKNKTLDINPKKIEAELKYNQWDVFRQCKKVYLILGGLLLVLAFISMFRKEKWMGVATALLAAGVVLGFIVHITGMGFRWYIAGYAPWSNAYETMIYVSLATVFAGLLFIRRSPVTFALATLFGGIILFVSGLNWMNPQISPLVPVLKSPWLMFHVAVIVAAYGFFGISCLIGITNQCLMAFGRSTQDAVRSTGEKRTAYCVLHPAVHELSLVNEMSLIIGLALMTVGTFLGAVWANESWGRYWGWDPKETWALITVIVYAIVLHLRLIKKWDNEWLLNVSSVVAFASVLMTYFGVNYFLSGMHSYGQNDNMGGIFMYMYIALAVVVLLAVLSYKRTKKLSINN